MAKANTGRNRNEKSFPVLAQGKTFAADSADCAISGPAPSRRRCGVRLIGGGLETGGWIVYGDPRPEQVSATQLHDRTREVK